MVAHDYISPYLKSFEVPAVGETVDDDIPIYFSGENVHPIHDRKSKIVCMGWMVDVVTCSHYRLKIRAVVMENRILT